MNLFPSQRSEPLFENRNICVDLLQTGRRREFSKWVNPVWQGVIRNPVTIVEELQKIFKQMVKQ